MATTDKSYTLSSTSKGPYDFAFPYLNTKDVQVTLNGTRLIPIEEDSVNYKFTRQTTQITLVDTPSVGDKLRIYRATDDTNLSSTFYPGSAIKSGDLNDNFTQNLYTTQENTNDASTALTSVREWDPTLDSGNGDWKTAFAKADDAVTTADAAEDKSDTSKLATDSLVATNSGTAQAPVWVLQGDGSNTTQNNKGVAYAVDEAEAAVAAATAADAIADSAKLATDRLVATTSDGGTSWTLTGGNTDASTDPKGVKYAVDEAEAAVAAAAAADQIADNAKLATDRLVATTSDGGSTWTLAGNNTNASTDPKGVGYAITTAEAADVIADNAKLATDRLVATTSDGGSTWTLTGNNTNASTDPKGVGYAVAQAEAAVITANSASATVAQSAIYQVVANFAALPSLASVDNDKFYQINDSTLVQNESTVSGEPSGFIGDDELAVKLKSDTVSNPKVWVWQEYYATDPETRYRKKLIVENLTTISEDYTIGTGNNGFSIGPVTISANKTITIPANSKYVVMN